MQQLAAHNQSPLAAPPPEQTHSPGKPPAVKKRLVQQKKGT
jgi:hypothetical protein